MPTTIKFCYVIYITYISNFHVQNDFWIDFSLKFNYVHQKNRKIAIYWLLNFIWVKEYDSASLLHWSLCVFHSRAPFLQIISFFLYFLSILDGLFPFFKHNFIIFRYNSVGLHIHLDGFSFYLYFILSFAIFDNWFYRH